MKAGILSFIVFFFLGLSYGQDSPQIISEKVSILSKGIDSLRESQSKMHLEIEDLRESNTELSDSLAILQKNISTIQNQYGIDKNQTKFGAYILLIGLLLEVFGVIFLSSDSLSKEARKVRPVKVEYTMGNMGGNRTFELEIITLQIIGTIILVLGFAFQFIGTLLVLISDMITNAIGIGIILLGIFLFSWVVVKQIGREDIFRKLRSTFQNLLGIIMFRVEGWFHKRKKVICESCYFVLPISESTIEYLKPKKMDDLNCPRHFHIGHGNCIDPIFDVNREFPSERFEIISKPLEEFFDSDFEEIKQLLKKRTDNGRDWDDEFNQTVNRLDRINNYNAKT